MRSKAIAIVLSGSLLAAYALVSWPSHSRATSEAHRAKPPAAPPLLEASPMEGPRLLSPASAGIGRYLADLPLRDVAGQEVRLAQFRECAALVIASVNPSCPVSKRYLHTIAELAHAARDRHAGFLLMTADAADGEFRSALKAAGLDGLTVIDDAAGHLRRALGSTSSTDVFLLDRARTLVYRGAIDDQYGLGYNRPAAREKFLAAALKAVLAGHEPAIAATEAPGCAWELATAPARSAAPTYHREIERIMEYRCVECHRAGGEAPFALETYEQVQAKAGMIRKMVGRGLMPPWFATGAGKDAHSPWINDRTLSEDEREQLFAWLDARKPEGDRAEAPHRRSWPADWNIGTPDLVLQLAEPIEVPATGVVPYREVTVSLPDEEARWVRGFEVRPTTRAVVHHVLVFCEPKDGPEPDKHGEYLAAYLPGNSHVVYPEGFAKRIPPKSRLRFQFHLTPSGVAAQDQTRLGLLFAKTPPQHIVRVGVVANKGIEIPPGVAAHPQTAALTMPADAYLLGLMPHMHFRGKSFRIDALRSGGEAPEPLLELSRYDYNWQITYRYARPLYIPAGTRLEATGVFDNSAANPANPDPTATVRWGKQMTEEMLLAYVEYYTARRDGPQISQR